MSEEKETLKTRILAIVKHNKQSKPAIIISIVLLIAVIFGAVALGTSIVKNIQEKNSTTNSNTSTKSKLSLNDVKLDKASWEKLNIFFSNFSEAEVPFFQKNQISDDELIAFGIRHNILNNLNTIKILSAIEEYNNKAYNEKIATRYVSQSIKKYFGKTVSNKTVQAYSIDYGNGKNDVGYFLFKDGYYLIPKNTNFQIDPARYPNGETIKFTQVDNLKFDTDSGLYIAYLTIYKLSGDDYSFKGEKYSQKPEEWEKQNKKSDLPLVFKNVKATIKKMNDGSYLLIDYIETPATSPTSSTTSIPTSSNRKVQSNDDRIYFRDINNDGKDEIITANFKKETGNEIYNYDISINSEGKIYKTSGLVVCLDTNLYFTDFDVEDNTIEFYLKYDGPSDDPGVDIFQFNGGSLSKYTLDGFITSYDRKGNIYINFSKTGDKNKVVLSYYKLGKGIIHPSVIDKYLQYNCKLILFKNIRSEIGEASHMSYLFSDDDKAYQKCIDEKYYLKESIVERINPNVKLKIVEVKYYSVKSVINIPIKVETPDGKQGWLLYMNGGG